MEPNVQNRRGLTLRGADAYPCAFNYLALPAKVSIIQAGLASSGGDFNIKTTIGQADVGSSLSGGDYQLIGGSIISAGSESLDLGVLVCPQRKPSTSRSRTGSAGGGQVAAQTT